MRSLILLAFLALAIGGTLLFGFWILPAIQEEEREFDRFIHERQPYLMDIDDIEPNHAKADEPVVPEGVEAFPGRAFD